jgi:hypothetical protein
VPLVIVAKVMNSCADPAPSATVLPVPNDATDPANVSAVPPAVPATEIDVDGVPVTTPPPQPQIEKLAFGNVICAPGGSGNPLDGVTELPPM